MKAAQVMGEKQWWAIALVLGFFAFLLYANTIPNSYALDDELVTRNHPLTSKGIKAIPEIFSSYYYDNKVGNYYEYRPVVLASFAIEHTIFGDNPNVGHAINALLYGLACMVLLFVLRSLKPDVGWLFPALATLLFAAHPIHTEVVASIKNRDEIFSFLFGISALFWALRYARQGTIKEFMLFMLLIILSVLSKRSVLSYAVIIPLAACWLSNASLLRLLALAFPLMLLVLFFSPIYEKGINAVLIAVIIGFPIVLWIIKTISTQGVNGVTQPLLAAFKSLLVPQLSISTPAKTQKSITRNDWLPLATLLVLTFGALLALYLDLRVVMWLCLTIVFLSTLFLPNYLKPYPVLLVLLAIGVALSNFGFAMLTFIVMGLLLSNLYSYTIGLPRVLSAILALFVALVYLVIEINDVETAATDVAILFSLALIHYGLFQKRQKFRFFLPFFLFFFGSVGLYLEPSNYLIWVMDFLGGAYLLLQPWIKRPLVFYTSFAGIGLATLFVLTIYPNQPENPIYAKNLGAYYAALPDPYGDGTKTVTNIVPGAGRQVDFVENPLVASEDVYVRLATASKVMGYYTYLFVAPLKLRFYYGYNQIPLVDFTSPIAWLCSLGYLALLVLAFWLYKRDAILSFSLLYLLLGLLFISNIGVLITGIVAERLAFGTSLGFCMLLAWGIIKLFKLPNLQQLNIKDFKPTFLVVVAIITCLYAARTVVRNTNWSSKLALYTHDGAISPNSAKTQQLLGNFYVMEGIADERNQAKHFATAEKYLKQSLAVAPKFHSALFDLSHMYSFKNDCKLSVAYFEQFMAVSIPPPQALLPYAICLDQLGRNEDAARSYERFIASDPYVSTGYSNLNYLYFRMGNVEKAYQVAQQAIKMIPNDPDNYMNMAAIFLESGRPAEAIPYFEKAHSLRPNELKTVLLLWDLHSQVGDPERGRYFYNKAIEMGHKFE